MVGWFWFVGGLIGWWLFVCLCLCFDLGLVVIGWCLLVDALLVCLFASLGLLLLVGFGLLVGVCLGLLSLRFEYMLLHGVDDLFGGCFDLVASALGLLCVVLGFGFYVFWVFLVYGLGC